MQKYSPMITQYLEIKEKYKDYILFYRLGDFYEMFFDDATLASTELELVLTARGCGNDEKAPMCGVPYHSSESYIARLIEKGYKVAICEQTSDPKASKGIVKREVVRIITPGTVTESSMLDENRNNFIASVFKSKNTAGIAFCDITEGTIYSTFLDDKDISQKIINEIGKFVPREVILNTESTNDEKIIWFLKDRIMSSLEANQDFRYDLELAKQKLSNKFSNVNWQETNDFIMLAIGGLLHYIEETQISNIKNITEVDLYSGTQFMELDLNARRNLEISETMRDKNKKGSLLWVLDKTKTAMGSRLLRKWVEKPLINPTQITKRLNFVEELVEDDINRDEITDVLKNITDIERLISKVVYQNATPKDLLSLLGAINQIPQLKELIENFKSVMAKQVFAGLDPLLEVKELILSTISDDPSAFVRDGDVIRQGFSQDVDYLRDLAKGGKTKLIEIEAREREKTGIKTLKIGYNKVFGYYIEVTKSFIKDVPDYYIRKQTLANQERYIIEELKIHENTVLGAQDKLIKLEQEIYNELLTKIVVYVHKVQKTASAIANIDTIVSLANVAVQNDYSKPVVNVSDRIDIKDGRHPVVELVLNKTPFVPNNSFLNGKSDRVSIITGPNMAGKSTYMRQVALITIMAQIGSFVPCSYAEIGIVDKIFTRVGASDDLATGQSTFMVEMNEVSDVLKNATKKSLVILDEIGRGTSTFDGLSIAKSVVEYINQKICCKTLFSTHYHELTSMENEQECIKNYNIAVLKNGENISFLRKIIPGGTDDSYGIEVAKLAGLPSKVISRAKEILISLEDENQSIIYVKNEQPQITMIEENEALKVIKDLDLNTLTPIEALNIIYRVQKMI